MNDTIDLKGAILMYGTKENAPSYCTHHRAIIDSEGARLGEGVPLSINALEELSRSLGQRVISPLLHERVLAWGHDQLVWWLPSADRPIFFNTDDAFLKARSGVVSYPSLIFKKSNRNLVVGAVKGKSRPCSGDRVYHAPFLNISEKGEICWGTANLQNTSDGNPEPWEAVFVESRFTHSNFRNRRQIEHPGNIYKFWSDMLDGAFKTFPESLLIESGLSVGDFIGR